MTSPPDQTSTDVPGILLVLNDIVGTAEEEFNRWYQQQHVAERLGVPGFRSARRYRAVGGGPAYMAVYECESIEVLRSDTYRERLVHPTDWTTRVMPGFRNMLRSACRETWSFGSGMGGCALVVQCKPAPGRDEDARAFVAGPLARELLLPAALARMSLWESDAAVTGGPSPEMALRGGADKSADWILFLESYDAAKAEVALQAQLPACAAPDSGLQLGSCSEYQLIYARLA